MSTTIKKAKLDALRQHIEADGDNDLETVALLLGLEADDEEGVQAYVDRLKEVSPELFGAPVAAPVTVSFQLLNEDSLLADLEIVKATPAMIVLRRKVPRELVVVRLGGKDVELDILEMERTNPNEVRHGLPVYTLLTIARAAK